MAMTFVLDKSARLVETLDDYDAHLFAFADQKRPALSRIADAYYAPGPKFQPTTANIERFIATCERVSALLELAIERRATIWFDCD